MTRMAAAGSAGEFDSSELRLLYQVAQSLLREGEYGELLSGLLDATIIALGADRGFVLARDGEQIRATVARNFRSEALHQAEEAVSTSIAGAVLEEGKSLLIADAQASQRFKNKESVRRLGLRSVLCAPLVANNETFALVYLENRRIGGFGERHRQMLDQICSLAAPRLKTAIAGAVARKRAEELESSLGKTAGVITSDEHLLALLTVVFQIAPTDLPVLIQGETGTGKELIARALYHHSKRTAGPFVVLNCGAIPETLIDSELFGHVRGAFSGADRDRTGFLGTAHRGTLFLDEIGELPPGSQSRLLRVLQSGEFTRVGSVQPEVVNVRFIAATNRDLEREVEEGRFRRDLYFRLCTNTLQIPPLRERPSDIPLLASYFLRAHANRWNRPCPTLSAECLAVLSAYSFPGNVRELENEMARIVALSCSGALVEPDALNDRIAGRRNEIRPADLLPPMSLAEMERRLILSVLEHSGWNRTRTAEILRISREGLRTKMQRFDISGPGGDRD